MRTESGGDSGESQLFECRRCKVAEPPNLSGKRIEYIHKPVSSRRVLVFFPELLYKAAFFITVF